ncbi:MAG: glycosyltransferase family 4 protein [Lachnospiraceae bacterium]|nr:glycosyltransferase family 4 protein [Lachnospiraceae bacterium]
MKKVLILASVASMIDQFNMPNIELLQSMGYSVDVACNFREGNTCSEEEIRTLLERLWQKRVGCYQIDFARDVTELARNVKALWQVEHLLQKNDYAFLHCHSPIGGVVGRIAGKLIGTRVIYTAHGFHFYKGAPVRNWLIYYPIEKLCSYCTDVLITINQEDYKIARERMKAKRVEYLPGVGVNLARFDREAADRDAVRKKLGIPEGMTWVLSVGELIERKNQEAFIRAVARTKGICLTIAGQGPLREHLLGLIDELGVTDRVRLLGFRTDISELCAGADIFALPSFQEGLSMALMEAMSSAKPVVCSQIRGNTDLIDQGRGGFFFDPDSVESMAASLNKIMNADLEAMGAYNRLKIRQFDLRTVLEREREIYSDISRME